MSQYKRLPKIKTQKGGDEFVSAVDHAIRWFVQNRRVLIPLVVVVAVALAGLYGLKLRSEQRVIALNEALFKAEGDPPEAGPSQREARFQEILDKFGSTPAAVVAPLSLAKGAFEKGDFATSLKHLESAQESAPGFLKPLVAVARAEVLVQSGDVDGGLKLLRSLSQDEPARREPASGEPGIAGSYPKILEAEILMETGKKEEGEKILASLSSDIEEDRFVREKAREALLKLKLGLVGGNP